LYDDAAPEVRAILQDEAAAGVAAKSDDFWVLAAALKRFIEEEGHGSLPLEVCSAVSQDTAFWWQ